MEKKIKVIIADESAEFGQNCSNALKSYGMEVLLCAKDGRKLLDKINREKPDIVVADVFMPNMDIIGVLNELKNSDIKQKARKEILQLLIHCDTICIQDRHMRMRHHKTIGGTPK